MFIQRPKNTPKRERFLYNFHMGNILSDVSFGKLTTDNNKKQQ